MNNHHFSLSLLRSLRLVAVSGLLALSTACGTVGASAGSPNGAGPTSSLGTAAFHRVDSVSPSLRESFARREVVAPRHDAPLRLPNPCPPPHR